MLEHLFMNSLTYPKGRRSYTIETRITIRAPRELVGHNNGSGRLSQIKKA